ncbi:MAG: tetratricopeptide repeat protein [Thermodesulfovibrionales bacterium]|nr:tetratricopeptide repeat protein [Thermodesulfovibrionales bacterium]
MKAFFLIFMFCNIIISISHASMPVEVTITGCVKDGVFVSSETDYGTHKVKKDYKMKVMDSNTKTLMDIKAYNKKEIRLRGYLLPGDLFFVDKNSIQVIGNCNILSLEEQEKLAKELFTQMSKADKNDTDVFIRLYTRVINECPDTEKAQEAYWRLSNLYLQAFDKPDYEKIASLLEEAVRRYPNTPATPHYKQRLLRAYEETKQWKKAVGLYEEALKTNPEILSDPDNAATMISYAEALFGSGNKQKALMILNKVVGFGNKIEDWLLEVAKEKIRYISEGKENSKSKP